MTNSPKSAHVEKIQDIRHESLWIHDLSQMQAYSEPESKTKYLYFAFDHEMYCLMMNNIIIELKHGQTLILIVKTLVMDYHNYQGLVTIVIFVVIISH